MTLRLAGTDVAMFKPHHTRAAVTSVAHRKGVHVADILKVAGCLMRRHLPGFTISHWNPVWIQPSQCCVRSF